jgi:uncharacterized protein (TIGR02217 family)
MAFWLARERDGQHSDFIQRFDPRFWTIDFPRPMMASLVTTNYDSMKVDVEFHRANELAGLIWDSTDRYDHPLLAYETDLDYSRTTLTFRWRSSGVVPLDQSHGPTLTIEGRDSNGEARSWYVRLWNYAKGTPQDAVITLPFSALAGGWKLGPGSTPVNPNAIERMFISVTPPGHNPASTDLLPAPCVGWVEITEIACSGDRPMVTIGEVLLPPHGVMMATAFDDSYNMTPLRLLRAIRGLGYRDAITHYVGMSHYYRLTRGDSATLQAGQTEPLCAPAEAWHRSFFAECHRLGYEPIISLSYELFAEHCPPQWQQRFHDGAPALTGWDPPSALLSPANPAAMGFLEKVAARFVQLAMQAGLPVAFQVGEPWWWTLPDGRIALYDASARAAFGGNPPVIKDLREPLSKEQVALLDRAGEMLAASTGALRDRVILEAHGKAETMLLLFTPTFLDARMPEVRRANLPVGWAWPAYQRLQLEDYDWLTDGNQGDRYQAYEAVQQRLDYPLERQDYLAGFVLRPQDADLYWRRIDAGIDEAGKRGVPRCFVWALPQVNRDGYTRLPASEGNQMQAFDDVLYPLALGRDAGVSAEFSTSISLTASGYERRSSHWTDARLHFDVGPGLRSEQELGTLIAFFRARRGAARGFRLRDPFDHSSRGMTGQPEPFDQLLGLGDGLTARFRLCKHYSGPDAQVRYITRPRPDSVLASVGGTRTNKWELEQGGWIVFSNAPPLGAEVRAGFYFDVPVRFSTDRLDITAAAFTAGEAPSVPLIEVREAA